MRTIDITMQDVENFPGGWSVAPYSVFLALQYTTFNDNSINVLEFGAGEGTNQLYTLLKSKNLEVNYVSYETDTSFAYVSGVNYQIYQDDYSVLTDAIFDLVIVDGPHGVSRANWYGNFKKNVRPGTVILVDDYHHYTEFGQSLDNHFTYELINEFNINPMFPIIINSGMETVDDSRESLHRNKSHKIVRVV